MVRRKYQSKREGDRDSTGSHDRQTSKWIQQIPVVLVTIILGLFSTVLVKVTTIVWHSTVSDTVTEALKEKQVVTKPILQDELHDLKVIILDKINSQKPGSTASTAPTYMKGRAGHSGGK